MNVQLLLLLALLAITLIQVEPKSVWGSKRPKDKKREEPVVEEPQSALAAKGLKSKNSQTGPKAAPSSASSRPAPSPQDELLRFLESFLSKQWVMQVAAFLPLDGDSMLNDLINESGFYNMASFKKAITDRLNLCKDFNHAAWKLLEDIDSLAQTPPYSFIITPAQAQIVKAALSGSKEVLEDVITKLPVTTDIKDLLIAFIKGNRKVLEKGLRKLLQTDEFLDMIRNQVLSNEKMLMQQYNVGREKLASREFLVDMLNNYIKIILDAVMPMVENFDGLTSLLKSAEEGVDSIFDTLRQSAETVTDVFFSKDIAEKLIDFASLAKTPVANQVLNTPVFINMNTLKNGIRARFELFNQVIEKMPSILQDPDKLDVVLEQLPELVRPLLKKLLQNDIDGFLEVLNEMPDVEPDLKKALRGVLKRDVTQFVDMDSARVKDLMNLLSLENEADLSELDGVSESASETDRSGEEDEDVGVARLNQLLSKLLREKAASDGSTVDIEVPVDEPLVA